MTNRSSACFFDCPDACGISVETDEQGRFVRMRGNPEHGWSRGVLCAKTSWYGELVQAENRILQPHVRKQGGGFEPVSWELALERIGRGVGHLDSERILSLDYGGNMGVLARRFPGRVMEALGATRNDGGICDATSGAGYEAVFGRSIGFDLELADTCDVIVLWGCDAARTMPHLLPRLKRALQAGGQVIAIDIYQSDTLQWVEKQGGRGLIVHPGSDAALALGLAELAFEERRADLDFLKRESVGAAEFRAHIRGRYEREAVCAVSGLSTEEFDDLARVLHGAKSPLLKLGIGLCRRKTGGMTMRAITSYAAVLGIPERVHWESAGHFNLDLEDFDGGHLRPGGEAPPKVKLAQLGAALEGDRIQASFVWNHNPAVTVPNTTAVRRGLARPDHFVVVHELFWTATAKLADVVLPATTFLDQPDLLRSYGHRHLHYVPKVLEPRGETRSNLDAFSAIAVTLGLPPAAHEGDHEAWVERILDRNRDRFSSAEWERLHAHEPVKLSEQKHADWGTPSGKIELFSETLEAQGAAALPDATVDPGYGGAHDFWLWPGPSSATHNSTFLASGRHLGRLGHPRIQMHPEDAASRQIEDGGWVRLFNDLAQMTLRAELSERVPRRAVICSGFFNEELVPERTNINALVPDELSDIGDGSSLYSARVSVEATTGPE